MRSILFTFKVLAILLLHSYVSLQTVYAQQEVALPDKTTFWSLIQAGGWVMYIILIISVLMLALGAFCYVWLKPEKFIPREVKKKILDSVATGEFKKSFLFCQEAGDVLSKVLSPALKKATLVLEKEKAASFQNAELSTLFQTLNHLVESAGMRESDKIRSIVNWFSNIGVIAPMLGLLGTVLGMIRAFGAIAYKVETGKPVLLSSAISQAMVTTAGGLIIGIICMLLFYYFSDRMNRIIHTLEIDSLEVMDEMEQVIRAKRN